MGLGFLFGLHFSMSFRHTEWTEVVKMPKGIVPGCYFSSII